VRSTCRRARRRCCWQRYCSKNDTIGFSGPLAWGSFADDGEAISVRTGGLESEAGRHTSELRVVALDPSHG
jgi:hypothetical protein